MANPSKRSDKTLPAAGFVRSLWFTLCCGALFLPLLATAQWTYLPLPQDMRNASVMTTGNVRARCTEVSQGSCQRHFLPPTFARDSEIIETVPSGYPLKILEVQYDPDGYAVKVQGKNAPFWLFEPHSGSSSISMGGRPLRDSLLPVYTAFLAGDFAAIFGPPQEVMPQCFPGTVVIDNPIPTPDEKVPTVHQVPEFDSQAAGPGNKFNTNCQAFIGTDGEYGDWGKIIESELTSRPHLSLYLSDDVSKVKNMDRICPNFTRLTPEDKIRFWVWTFMSIAQVESTCRNNISATKASANGYFAQGLLQMEKQGEALDGKRSMWANNPNPERACDSPNIKSSAADNIRCGLDALANVLVGYHSCSKQEFIGAAPVITEENCQANILNNTWERFVCLPEQVTPGSACEDEEAGNGNFDAVTQRVLTFEKCGARQ